MTEKKKKARGGIYVKLPEEWKSAVTQIRAQMQTQIPAFVDATVTDQQALLEIVKHGLIRIGYITEDAQ